MLRIKHTVLTIAAVVATAGLIAPAAQANAGPYPRFAPKEHVIVSVDRVPLPTAPAHRGAWLEHRALGNTVDHSTVNATGRIVSTDGGIDWTFPVMGVVALALVMMIVGEQILVRRRRLAT
jgi:hypothetical protein